jgi:hypothetical protein
MGFLNVLPFFLIFIHFLSPAHSSIANRFKKYFATKLDRIQSRLLGGLPELIEDEDKTSSLKSLMSPLFEMNCITIFPVTPHEFSLQKVDVLAEKIPHNLDFGHHLLNSTPQSSHGQHPVKAS